MQKTTIRLNEHDNVIIATTQLMQGNVADGIIVSGLIPAGHKIAAEAIPAGTPVRRYNQIIGVATRDIKPGQHVHTHNMEMMNFDRDYNFCAHRKEIAVNENTDTYMGIVRPDGRVATRNFIGILTSVNCSATVAKAIADHFRRDINPDALADFPNVDGVVALPHSTGCGMSSSGVSMDTLRRTLIGYARQVNFHSVLMIGLGCETNQISGVMAAGKLEEGPRLYTYSIQDSGGTSKAVAKGIAKVKEMLPEANCQPGTGRCRGQTRARGRHRHPVGNPGNIWRRAPADPARRKPRSGRKTGQAHQVVGRLLYPQPCGDE
jgi:altronate hydrolase